MKRSRPPETVTPSKSDASLSPHTLRLIRLVREGTAQHAELAAAQLSQKKLTPLQLWNCLGLLQESLWSDSIQSRLNAGVALEGVAKHLPAEDQRNFLSEILPNDPRQRQQQYLTLDDIEKNYKVILEKGQSLWSENEEVHNQPLLSTEDVEERMRQQRQILADRMGLGALQSVLGSKHGMEINKLIHRSKDQAKKKKIAVNDTDEKEKSEHQEQEKTSVTELLVIAMSQSTASHQSPQRLLATELLYRMFDPSWTIRHGAMVGILALFKAWKTNAKGFGTWPHDLLARSLCLLLLDRLSDFQSSHAVAPCRALAGQLISLCLVLAPTVRATQTVNLWRQMAKLDTWEVRHGVFLAMRYLTCVITEGLLDVQASLKSCLTALERLFVGGIEDSQDDVQSEAAEGLCLIVSKGLQSGPSFVGVLWQSLRDKPTVATGLVSLINLTVACLHHNNQELGFDDVWKVLRKCLDAEYADVRRGALQAMGQVARSREAVGDEEDLCSATEKVFDLYFTEFRPSFLDTTWDALISSIADSAATNLLWKLLVKYMVAPYPTEPAAAALSVLALRNTTLVEAAIRMGLKSFLMSPFEAACLLCRYICQKSEAHCYHELLQGILVDQPNCLLLSDTQAKEFNAHFSATMHEALNQVLGMVISGASDPTTASKVFDDLACASVKTCCGEMPVGGSSKTNVRVFRCNATVAVTIVLIRIPARITPCVRALMTSLLNEVNSYRQEQSAKAMTQLLVSIQIVPSQQKAFDKIVGNLCDAVVQSQGSAATSVLRRLVSELATKPMSAAIPQLWHRLDPLLCESQQDCKSSISLVESLSAGLVPGSCLTEGLVRSVVPGLVSLACSNSHVSSAAKTGLIGMASRDIEACFQWGVPSISSYLAVASNMPEQRIKACELLKEIVTVSGPKLSLFVRELLPLSMSLMTDSLPECAAIANSIFALVVRVAPLSSPQEVARKETSSAVLEHLILGKPLPRCTVPDEISTILASNSVVLRDYQWEGIAWLQFLRSVKLNGVLCDAMGLGKTIQALVCLALAHHDNPVAKSLIVCPSTLVRHWVSEVDRFFGGEATIFKVLPLVGNGGTRKALWHKNAGCCNIVVTSYSTLRSDVTSLCSTDWKYCVLDEGHLLKNPKTATAIASKKIHAEHRLILSGTPVQNHVDELWSIFDFLMPNFLGSARFFSKEYSRAIAKGQAHDASAESLAESMNKLKVLHQQVLPFILRREKNQVLRELPDKIITFVKVPLSKLQRDLYTDFCRGEEAQRSIAALEEVSTKQDQSERLKSGSNALKSLLFLRLLCTHPLLVKPTLKTNKERCDWSRLDTSGKLLAISELLQESGIYTDSVTAADNDTSLLYCCEEEDQNQDEYIGKLHSSAPLLVASSVAGSSSKCLIFAQFSRSLDIIEELLFKPHMPSLRYLRLDGKVPAEKRQYLANEFNENSDIRVMLLSTRVGSLGLNLTEHDFNPFADLQAMDRAHRIGQKATVNVYKLVCEDSIDEKLIDIQQKKVLMSEKVVNTENSTMFSMGTDRLLDIFTFRSEQETDSRRTKPTVFDLDSLVEGNDDGYTNLQVESFARSFRNDLPSSQEK